MESSAKNIRDILIRELKRKQEFKDIIVAEIDGCHFAAADIALPTESAGCEVFRIAVLPFSLQTERKGFEVG